MSSLAFRASSGMKDHGRYARATTCSRESLQRTPWTICLHSFRSCHRP